MIGLVTVLYKCDEMLEGFFKSLALQEFQDYHLYLIDNSVNDSTTNLISELVKKYEISNVSHVLNSENVGVATGNNQGIRASLEAGFTHTLLLNNDIEFSQSTLLGDMGQAAIDNNEAMVIPKILFYDSGLIWMAGGRLIKWRAITSHVGEGRESNSVKFNRDRYFEYAPTCFMLISNLVFEKVGLMDENYFVYYDDTDFIFRATKIGYRIFYLHHLEIYHKVSSSTGGSKSNFSVYYVFRNRMYFIGKHSSGIQRIVSKIYLDLLYIIKYILLPKGLRESLKLGYQEGLRLFKKEN